MAIERPAALDIDDEFAKATLHEIAARMEIELPPQTTGQLRLPCFFCDSENEKSYGSLVINLDHPANLFKAHCCGVKGNRLTLMYAWKYRTLPSGGSVRGDAYNEMVTLHRVFTGSLPDDSPPPEHIPKEQTATRTEIAEVLTNVPLKDSEREDIRALVGLCGTAATSCRSSPHGRLRSPQPGLTNW